MSFQAGDHAFYIGHNHTCKSRADGYVAYTCTGSSSLNYGTRVVVLEPLFRVTFVSTNGQNRCYVWTSHLLLEEYNAVSDRR